MSLRTCNHLPNVYTPNNISKFFPIKRIEDVFLLPKEVHSIGALSKQIGNDEVMAYIELMIFDFIKFVNPVRSMTSIQIRQTAELIIDVHYLLKIPEVAFIFKLAKTSYFGAIFEGIDGMKILSWFDKYFQERLDSAELFSEKEHKNNKIKSNLSILSVDKVKEAYNKIANTEFVKSEQPLKLKLSKEEQEDLEYQKFKADYHKNQNK